MRLIVAATLSLALATPVLAVDAITYKGTLGKLPIIAELAASSDGVLVGRYSYLNKGGDIPLDAGGGAGGPILLAEEAPCTETTCIQDDNGDVPDKPIGAYWTLVPSEDGATITGSWAAVGKSGKTLDIKLERIGQRALADGVEVSPFGLYDSAFQTTYAGLSAFTPETAPYDFAKMDVPLEIGSTQTIEGSSFHYVADPRSKFLFPRIVALADGSAPDLANKALARRHALINFHAFDCMAMIYAGFGANQYSAGRGPGSLGDYDGENVEVSYLSPTVMSWSESGSTWCGGAHPNNHSDSYNLDVRAGATLAMAKVFKDWTATYRATGNDDGWACCLGQVVN
ncbi:MAG: hypothetical protein KKF33_12090, partial [Alphaproteobacteria bacterium]|nr:hypothetical protein [Alphaproteobacteria bacterium]